MRKFLIGSVALAHYWPGYFEHRITQDIDVLCHEDYVVRKYGVVPSTFRKSETIGFQQVEYTIASDESPYKSDGFLYEYCCNLKKLRTFMFWNEIYEVVPLEVLKMLKLSCVDYLNKPKHKTDLCIIGDEIVIDEALESILALRKLEVQARVKAQKEYFFNHYNIERYVEHDHIHKVINPNPTYHFVLVDGVTPCQNLFNELIDEDKRQIVWEEILALAIERFYIPNFIRNPLSFTNLYSQMIRTDSEVMKYWIGRFGGDLKDHPPWLAEWTRKNDVFIKLGMTAWLNKNFNRIQDEIMRVALEGALVNDENT